ncbi:MAG: aminotransferase class I/II-fold pyridoxal phosphate-dependent enzyme [Acidobacteriota bacterium]|nr:aminotransferase class I/II-fold pyridoxal phosphate-dependent enzyme [Acidobacteriota bacterium]
MPHSRFEAALARDVDTLTATGRSKGVELEITGFIPATGDRGPRCRLAGHQNREFLKMNSNGYLGMANRPDVIAAEEQATRDFGAGPGAVRFISGTYAPHLELERRLASFHGREAGMIFSSAYATIVGILSPLITSETAVVSDELNHNCIINAMRLSRPKTKKIYRHSDPNDLRRKISETVGQAERVIVVTDGVFSMRGDWAPLPEIMALAHRFDGDFNENVVVLVDDSHGVGAFGSTGRGTEEATGSEPADILVGTLGKALGVNGGYVVGGAKLIRFLRETAPLYIYSNPITPGEAAAARKALEILDNDEGLRLLSHLREMTARFEKGLVELGFETIPGGHPVVPLMVRDTEKTSALVRHLFDNGILATGLNYPVVPQGDEEIRFQISAAHTPFDIDSALEALAAFSRKEGT